MNVSLDDYIRESKSVPNTNMSLDEYIHVNHIKSSAHSYRNHHHNNNNNNININGTDHVDSGPSKFDRYKYQDENDDDMDEDGSAKQMPALVEYVARTMPPKSKPIHQRLGERGSICESIHTSQMKLFQPNRFKAKNSVQSRLGKGFVNPAVVERNRITAHTLKALAKDDVRGQMLLNAFTKAIKEEAEAQAQTQVQPAKKYDMEVQKEISLLQGKKLYYACPGGFVISSDGPGLRGMLKVPSHSTDISLNQRFA